jgi:hypothetical protein
LSAGKAPPLQLSPPPHEPVHRKKGQVSGYDRPVSWIYIYHISTGQSDGSLSGFLLVRGYRASRSSI